jgi:hypothetical protein
MKIFLLFLAIHAESAVTKSKFVKEFTAGLPISFCESNTYFRKCFSFDEANCKKIASASIELCVKELEKEIPTNLASVDDGKKWGGKLGECAGRKFELDRMVKKVSSEDCSNPEKWK